MPQQPRAGPDYLSTKSLRPPRIYYGWWMVGSTFLSNALLSAVFVQGFGLFLIPLTDHLKVSRGALSGAFSLSYALGGLVSPWVGWAVDRYGARPAMALGIGLFGLGFVLLSLVDSLLSFYLVFIFAFGIASTLTVGTTSFIALGKWFVRHRAKALTMSTTGFGIGALMVPVTAALITGLGWQHAALVVAIAIWAVGFPLVLVVRESPERYGLRPDGVTEGAAATETGLQTAEEIDFSMMDALHTRALWLFAVCMSLYFLVSTGVMVHLIPSFEDRGYSRETAASFIAIMGLVTVAGRLAAGWLADRYHKKLGFGLSGLFMALGLLILAPATKTWHLALFLVVYGLGNGTLVVLWSHIGDYFGRKSFGRVIGLINVIGIIGTVAGPWLAGWSRDRTGGYAEIFAIFGLIVAGGTALALLVPRPQVSRAKQRTPSA